MLGSASSPIMAGLISQASLRVVFLAMAVAYLLAVGLVFLPKTRSQKSGARSQEPAIQTHASHPSGGGEGASPPES
jgi:hypothetical protein